MVVNLSTTVRRPIEGPSLESESEVVLFQVAVSFVRHLGFLVSPVQSWLENCLIKMRRVGDRLIVLEVVRLCIEGG